MYIIYTFCIYVVYIHVFGTLYAVVVERQLCKHKSIQQSHVDVGALDKYLKFLIFCLTSLTGMPVSTAAGQQPVAVDCIHLQVQAGEEEYFKNYNFSEAPCIGRFRQA